MWHVTMPELGPDLVDGRLPRCGTHLHLLSYVSQYGILLLKGNPNETIAISLTSPKPNVVVLNCRELKE